MVIALSGRCRKESAGSGRHFSHPGNILDARKFDRARFIILSDGFAQDNHSVRKASIGSVFAALRAGITAAINAAAARTIVVITKTKGSWDLTP